MLAHKLHGFFGAGHVLPTRLHMVELSQAHLTMNAQMVDLSLLQLLAASFIALATQVAARVQHTDIIRVENWAPASQRFRAIPTLDSAPPASSLTGPDAINVPAHGSTAWAYKFSAKAEGTATGRVTFKNESTGEYRLWNVTFKVSLDLKIVSSSCGASQKKT